MAQVIHNQATPSQNSRTPPTRDFRYDKEHDAGTDYGDSHGAQNLVCFSLRDTSHLPGVTYKLRLQARLNYRCPPAILLHRRFCPLAYHLEAQEHRRELTTRVPQARAGGYLGKGIPQSVGGDILI